MSEQIQDQPIFSLEECRRFIADCGIAVSVSEQYANLLADLLVEADYRGHYSHGMNRLDIYVSAIQKNICNPTVEPEIIKESISTGLVDGHDGLGVVVGVFAMNLAIKKAQQTGIGMVVAKRSNHFGITGYYTQLAINAGVIGMAFTNSSPVVVPTRAKNSNLGSNPISFAAPASNDDNFFLDMATSTVCHGKIEMQQRKNEPIPENWALDENSEPTTDPGVALKYSKLTPLGGSEQNCGYKGYGLSAMVEILCGVLSGGPCSSDIRPFFDTSRTANLSHCFIAIDPKRFHDNFKDRLTNFLDYFRNLQSLDPNFPVLVPGDPERSHMAEVDSLGGLTYVQDQLDYCANLAKTLGVKPLTAIN